MLVFITDEDFGYPVGDKMAREVMAEYLEKKFGCKCLVIDCWCKGVFLVDDEQPWRSKPLYGRGLAPKEQRDNYAGDVGKVFGEHTQNEGERRNKNIRYRNLVLKSLLAFLLGILTTHIIKLL